MIKLKHITKNDNIITCYAYFEDCPEPVNLSLSIDSEKLQDCVLPTGYEWCKAHIQHAKQSLLKMFKDGDLEEEKTIMWY